MWRKRLFLYFALLGSNAAAFEPGGTLATRWVTPGRWLKPRRILFDDFIPWSVKSHHGHAYMLGYTGGGGTFQPNPPPKHVYWLTTRDGWSGCPSTRRTGSSTRASAARRTSPSCRMQFP